ncbi:unnamed protein product [Kuraishia capsulata CBS 1993]|uniref:Phosphodiesterase n=1 Tax=Kuraishia capsulata CBS 1993 TaxID=1382522 RepID=W6MMQ3_9ASCO|nr:uncharacterized protein KUCA_T00003864001 [Kuraishia capsulata CBS 1993]CDK27884.1 unnamed protein product [Kuraishia capsulata CBS 1993]
MILEVLVYDPVGHEKAISSLKSSKFDYFVKVFSSFHGLVSYLLGRNSYTLRKSTGSLVELVPNSAENDLFHNICIVLDSDAPHRPEDLFEDKEALLRYRFQHLNLSVIPFSFESSTDDLNEILEKKSLRKAQLLKDRLPRIQTWVGLIENVPPCILTMPNVLETLDKKPDGLSLDAKVGLVQRLANAFDYRSLMELKHPEGYYSEVVGQWEFPAHDLTIDELLYCGFVMLKLGLQNWDAQNAEMGKSEIPTLFRNDNTLLSFLFHVRDNYRLGNPFHNFRHAIDVLQASFYFVSKLQAISANDSLINNRLSKELMNPCATALLLVASLGHDIGHPGITNPFLTAHKTPVAAYFKDQSVLENFHLTQFCSILEPYAVTAPKFYGSFSQVFISDCILATDMAKHDLYTSKITDFMPMEAVDRSKSGVKTVATNTLAALLIKCADISNVCRPLRVSVKWGISLNQEFSEVAALERLMKDSTSAKNVEKVPSVPVSSLTPQSAMKLVPSLSGSQLFFIERFAEKFFNEISDSLPALDFLSEELEKNKLFWKKPANTT